ncbi:uncharacterized protein LOC126880769 [Diabrotica virgifera virgifera]|uniref:Uncharacterized protein n=1 Tax=Diabrotica virgifera virgifera TaxID=50390 RepID=A0ABM5JS72_DIAVI|nr:uncharacterized protein LOC126880769 [Diabrotica virgifera virgifera]
MMLLAIEKPPKGKSNKEPSKQQEKSKDKNKQQEEKKINKHQKEQDNLNKENKEKKINKNLKSSESWFCHVCNEDRQADMRLCLACGQYMHEECVGLTKHDKDKFICPNCSQE